MYGNMGSDRTSPQALSVTPPHQSELQSYFAFRYHIDPLVQPYVDVFVERWTEQTGWQPGQTIPLSSEPSSGQPELIEITERSEFPIQQQDRELFRLRYVLLAP